MGKEAVAHNKVENESIEFKEQPEDPSTSRKQEKTEKRVGRMGPVEIDTKLRKLNMAERVGAASSFLPNGGGKGTPEPRVVAKSGHL